MKNGWYGWYGVSILTIQCLKWTCIVWTGKAMWLIQIWFKWDIWNVVYHCFLFEFSTFKTYCLAGFVESWDIRQPLRCQSVDESKAKPLLHCHCLLHLNTFLVSFFSLSQITALSYTLKTFLCSVMIIIVIIIITTCLCSIVCGLFRLRPSMLI